MVLKRTLANASAFVGYYFVITHYITKGTCPDLPYIVEHLKMNETIAVSALVLRI